MILFFLNFNIIGQKKIFFFIFLFYIITLNIIYLNITILSTININYSPITKISLFITHQLYKLNDSLTIS